MTNGTPVSALAIVAALVATVALSLMAALFIGGDDAQQRLALVFGVIAIVVPALIGMLRSDLTATRTNGNLTALRAEIAALKAAAAVDGSTPAAPLPYPAPVDS